METLLKVQRNDKLSSLEIDKNSVCEKNSKGLKTSKESQQEKGFSFPLKPKQVA